MRELLVCPAERRTKVGAVHRLQFGADGRELAAWVEARDGATGVTAGLHVSDLTTGIVRPLVPDRSYEDASGLAVSSDLRFLAATIDFDRSEDGLLVFEDLHEPDVHLPTLSRSSGGEIALLFTPDGSSLVTVQLEWNGGDWAADVLRFEVNVLTKEPRRIVRAKNPLNGQPYRKLDVRARWKPVLRLPPGGLPNAAALSADGRLIAVGTEDTTVHVADLKRRKVLTTLPWEGRKLRFPAVERLALDPSAEWVVSLAHARLFARPLNGGKGWNTKDALGAVNDFAYHPDGRVLCAVFRDGQARFLDPRTGAVRQAFKWAKKPAPLYAVAFAPDGLTCAAGSENGKVIVWDVDL